MDEIASKQLLTDFNRVSGFLQELCHVPDNYPFPDLLVLASDPARAGVKYAPIVRGLAAELRELAKARNLMVHAYRHNQRLVVPHPDAVKRMAEIRKNLLKPASLGSLFKGEVVRCSPDDPVGTAAQRMLEKDYSQIPVCCGTVLSALLTTDTIARWLAKSLARIGGMTDEVPVKDVLNCTEAKEPNYQLLDPDDTVIDALYWFETCRRNRRRLDAILLTNERKPNNPIIGIITAFNIPQLYSALGLSTGVEADGQAKTS